MSPFRSPKSPSTPAAVHRIESKAKIAKFKTSLSAAKASRVFHDAQADRHLALKISLSADKASRVIHDAQADYHLAQAQASADEEAALDTKIRALESAAVLVADMTALEEEANRNILGLNISSNGEKEKKPWYRFGF